MQHFGHNDASFFYLNYSNHSSLQLIFLFVHASVDLLNRPIISTCWDMLCVDMYVDKCYVDQGPSTGTQTNICGHNNPWTRLPQMVAQVSKVIFQSLSKNKEN